MPHYIPEPGRENEGHALIQTIRRKDGLEHIQILTQEEHRGLHNGEKNNGTKIRRRNKRPGIMPEPKGYYIHGANYPDTVRISFEDGHTEIYDRRISQPSPAGYVNNSRRGKP